MSDSLKILLALNEKVDSINTVLAGNKTLGTEHLGLIERQRRDEEWKQRISHDMSTLLLNQEKLLKSSENHEHRLSEVEESIKIVNLIKGILSNSSTKLLGALTALWALFALGWEKLINKMSSIW